MSPRQRAQLRRKPREALRQAGIRPPVPLLAACAAGAALLLISEDLDEVFALADRIAVMHHGRLTPARPVADWTLAAIGLAMAGVAASSELADAA